MVDNLVSRRDKLFFCRIKRGAVKIRKPRHWPRKVRHKNSPTPVYGRSGRALASTKSPKRKPNNILQKTKYKT
jgi:hypothetical protein